MSPETLTASAGVQAQEAEEAEKVGVGAYISLFFAMCFFPVSSTKCQMHIAGSVLLTSLR